ncbi:MAG: aldo/keto reductase [Methanosarcinaceae archaeon]|nr:aldo/keto reductase [Methanosarcinaceae archaeon]
MLYREIQKNGDRLSTLGFGCMRLPETDGKIDEERATRQLRHAIDQGVNYVDTAYVYHMGQSEPFLGRALSDGYREKVRLATKLPTWFVEKREDMDRFLAEQLNKLQTDHIDYYLVHGLERSSWDKMRELGVLSFLDSALAEGKIRYAGFSFHGDRDTFREIVDAYDWAMCLIQYNYLDKENQAGTEGLRYAAGKGLGVMIMEPLRGGNLVRVVPPEVQAIWDKAPVKRTPAEWGLRWVWDHPEVTVVLSGMNDEANIEENIRIASTAKAGSLTAEERDIVAEVAGTYRRIMKVPCTGCRYCMPCPYGVDIPNCFELYNNLFLSGDTQMVRMFYAGQLGGVMGEKANASLCQECGKCVEVCPQHIAIPEELKHVAEELEGEGFPETVEMFKQFFKPPGT